MAQGAELPKLSTEYAGVPMVVTTGVQFTDRTDPDGRFDLSLQTAELCRDGGIPLVVADTSQLATGETWVADALRKRGAVVLNAGADNAGIAKQRQLAARHALGSGAEAIGSWEADKVGLVGRVHHIAAALAIYQYDALAIGRTPNTLRSLPPVQQRTEEAGGHLFTQILDIPRDAWSGARAFNRQGAQGLLAHPSDAPGMNNWTWLYSSLMYGQNEGLEVGSLEADFPYPKGMVAYEVGNPAQDDKRAQQFVLQARWAAEQGRVERVPGARALADFVVGELAELPDDIRAVRYDQFADGPLPKIEAHMAEHYGYQPVGR